MEVFKISKYKDNIHLKDQNNTTTQIFNSVKNNSLILDVGCASGYLAKLFVEKKNCTVIGIEPNVKDAKTAKQFCKDVLTLDIEEKIWEDKLKGYKFDHIVFADVLEHLRDPGDVLKRIKPFLKPEGSVLISLPNIAHISIRFELLKGDFNYEKTGILDSTHLKYFTKKSFLKLAEASGFKAKKVAAYSFDFPEQWMKDYLEEFGLKPEPKAFRIFSSEDAVAYQYFFELLPSERVTGKQLQENKPIYNVRKFLDSVEIDHKKFKSSYENEVKRLQQENQMLHQKIQQQSIFKNNNTFLAKVLRKLDGTLEKLFQNNPDNEKK